MNRRACLLVLLAAVFTIAAALPRPAGAQAASLVRDILPPTPPQQTGVASSSPHHLLPVQSRVFFVASEASTTEEVWVSDGTPAGTQLLKDVCPGPCSSSPPTLLGALGNVAVWLQASGVTSGITQLWRSDGTRAGTYVLDPTSSGLSVWPAEPLQTGKHLFLGGRLLFIGCTEAEGCEIWSTDGTLAGTRVVREIVPGDNSYGPTGLTPLGRKALFFGRGADERPALWSTDGTFAGTSFVRTLPNLPRLTAGGEGRIFFVIDETLWVSDGTQAGTRELRTFVRESFSTESVLWLRNFGGQAWFTAYDPALGGEIWRSDGTPAGTVPATTFPQAQPFGNYQAPIAASMTAAGGRLVFLAREGDGMALWSTAGTPASMAKIRDVTAGSRLPTWDLTAAAGKVFFLVAGPGDSVAAWSTDGTSQGTARLTEVCRSSSCYFGEYRAAHGGVLFHVETGRDAAALWFSDGTPAGTRRYVDLPRGVRIGARDYRQEEAPRTALAGGGKLFFTAEDDAHGEELWIRDGARGPVRLAANLAPDAPSSDPRDLQAAGGKLFLVACGGIVSSAGTAESTVALSPGPVAGACVSSFDTPPLRTAGGLAFFTRRPAFDVELWRSDGTPGGTFQLTTLGYDFLGSAVELDGKLLFVDSAGSDYVLRASDGSPAGTSTVFQFPTGTWPPSHLTRVGGEVYFITRNLEGFGRIIWRTDGRPGGTHAIGTFGESQGVSEDNPWFVRFGPHVYFMANDGELWRTDGTAAGTSPLLPSLAPYPASYIHQTLVWRGHLYFFSGTALWRTDGTEAGTVLLEETPAGVYSDDRPAGLTAAGNHLFFSALTPGQGRELWRTDGTPGGATVFDLFPGPAGSRPTGLREAGGRLYFAADDGVRGRELWRSDGTPAGTRLVQDLAPQGASSSPDHLTVLGDRLYFSADDGFYGRELWALPLDQPGCAPASGHLCLNGGRFRVEIAWKDFQGNTGAGQAVPLTADTGYFWFFDAANVEVVVKVLDGQALNGHFWVFYGALSSVEYTLTVTDTQTGLRRRYFNPSGSLASLGDTRGFGPLGAFSTAPETVGVPRGGVLASVRTDPAAVGTCTPAPRRLCLGGGRFAVTASWKDFQGNTGEGTAVGLTADTGYFWFFDPANVEVVAKALDGSALNGHFWFFYGALSSVEYTLTVTDTTTGEVKTYRNPAGRFASVADTEAF